MPRFVVALVFAVATLLALTSAAIAVPVVTGEALAPEMTLRDSGRAIAFSSAIEDDDDNDGDGDDRDDDDDDDDRSGSDDADSTDTGSDDCDGRPDDDDDDEDPVVVTGPIPSGASVIDLFDDDCFTPGTATIDMGASVTFVNHHSDEHTATGSAFDTGLIDTGETATVTLETPGTYAFGCIIHPEMTGTIGVRDASGLVPSPTPPASAPPATAAVVEVAIIDFGFEPTESIVGVGTTVAWTVTQQSPHTATAADGSFDSGILDAGGTYQHTFLEPGTFAYACRLHPEMQATVVVDPSLPAVSPLPGAPAGASPSAGP